MTTHEVLVAARNHAAAGHCVTNATFHAVAMADMDAQRSAHRWLLAMLNRDPSVVGTQMLKELRDWHDAPSRTREEVLALFDKVIAQTAPEPDVHFLMEQDEPSMVTV